ncbi:MAG: hypothetical protein LBJ00_07810 [Planctomycetaceae bacterium]|jgi:hypothetical protein|nr:hypothetical protein [Planctomycetaceae bacterium]
MDNEFFQRDTEVAHLPDSASGGEEHDAGQVTLDDAIFESAKTPKRVQSDAGSVEQHSLQDLIAVERFLLSKRATQKGIRIHLTKISPDGSV